MTQTPGGRVLAELIGQAQTDADLAQAHRALYSADLHANDQGFGYWLNTLPF